MRRCVDGIELLPGPQRDALRVVFGLSSGATPDRFLVGLAVLSLVSEAAEERPLLCVVDDAQWLDQSSALTLAFVSRRLLAEPVGFVFAARQPGPELQHLPDLAVRGLVNGDARALLSSSVGFTLDRRVGDRIIAETRGNPLALLDLPRGLTPTELIGGFGMPESRDLSEQIEKSYIRRLEALPADTQLLLLVAAAEPVGDPLLLQRACERLGVELSAVDAADGLLALEERVTFRHPLARSAVYRAANGPERRAAHLALAEVTDPDVDPDRRAWHLATAATGPDEEIARELELSAERARARGGMAAAAAFLHRAVALTDEPARRADRALAAAQANLRAGVFDVTRGLLAAAETGPLDELGRARLDLLRAELAFVQNRGSDAPLLLLGAAKKLETLDLRLSRDTYLEAWSAALFAGHLAVEGGSLLDVSRAVVAAPKPDPALPGDRLLDGLALVFTDGRPAAAPVLQRRTRDVHEYGGLHGRGASMGFPGHTGRQLRMGLRPRTGDRHACARARPRIRGARVSRCLGQRLWSIRLIRRRLGQRQADDGGGRCRQGSHRQPHRPPTAPSPWREFAAGRPKPVC